MRRPWGKVLFHRQIFCRGMNATTLEKAFCSWFSRLFPECSHNLGECRGQWFRHAVLPRSRYSHQLSFVPGLCSAPPRLPTSFTLFNICKRARFATQTLCIQFLSRVEKDTLFKDREPRKPYPIPRHVPIQPIYGSTPPGGVLTLFTIRTCMYAQRSYTVQSLEIRFKLISSGLYSKLTLSDNGMLITWYLV